MFTAIGQKKGMVRREKRSGRGRVVRNSRAYEPSARTPAIACARPPSTASAPTISWMWVDAGDSSFGFATRLKAATKLAAVIRPPVWKR